MSIPHIGVVGITGAWSSQRLVDAFLQRGCTCDLLDLDHAVYRSTDNDSESSTDSSIVVHGTGGPTPTDLTACDAVVVKKLSPTYSADYFSRLDLLDVVAARGVPVFSPPAALRRCYSRQSNTLTLLEAGIPMPPTVLTESHDAARAAVVEFGTAICKPLFTSKARGMQKLSADDPDLDQHLTEHQQTFGPFYLQQAVELPGRDLGIVFLGGEYLATYARTKTDAAAWNTTTANGGKYQAHQPTADQIELARSAQAAFGMSFTCVDVAETPSGSVVFEVSAFGGFRGLEDACGIDAAGAYADYVLNEIGHTA